MSRLSSAQLAGVVLTIGTVALLPAAALAGPGSAAPDVPPAHGRLVTPAAPARRLPSRLYGVTVDDSPAAGPLVRSLRHLGQTPTTRVYFDSREPARHYAALVRALRPASYVMGELLDSSDETAITVAAYRKRVRSYVAAFGHAVDLWEIGNEVNGGWTGPYPTVAAKLAAAYQQVHAAGGRTALTLYYNVGCGDGASEISPLDFSRNFVSRSIRQGLNYVFLSYYADDCGNLQPSSATWTSYFRKLHALYPHARLGFGEIGMNNPATVATMAAARSLIRRYYGLSVRLPYYVGGYFWWYYAEDCVPYRAKPLWSAIRSGFAAENASPR